MVGRCLHCLSAFTASTTGQNAKGTQHHRRPAVSIAFRHSPRPPPRAVRPEGHLRGNGCLHCLSAFTASTTSHLERTDTMNLPCLHCLSAFTASTTYASQEMAHHEVCLHCLSAFTASTTMNEPITKQHISASPLPFGIHRVHHNEPLPEALKVAARLHCLSAFTASTTGRASRHKALPKCLHCLSAFTASTTSVMLTVVAVKSEVSIAF